MRQLRSSRSRLALSIGAVLALCVSCAEVPGASDDGGGAVGAAKDGGGPGGDGGLAGPGRDGGAVDGGGASSGDPDGGPFDGGPDASVPDAGPLDAGTCPGACAPSQTVLGALCGTCSREVQTCSATCALGPAVCTPQPGCAPPATPQALLERSCYCINCLTGDLPSLDRARCAYVRWAAFPWGVNLSRGYFDGTLKPFAQGALARGMVTEFGVPEFLAIPGAACPADRLYRVSVDPAVLPAWNTLLLAHRPAATVAPFPTGVSELTFNVDQLWTPTKPSWVLGACAGVPSLQTDEGWRYHLFASLAAIDAGAGALYLSQLSLRRGATPLEAARVTALLGAARAWFAQKNPGRRLVVGAESLDELAGALVADVDFTKEVLDLDVVRLGAPWPQVLDSDGTPYACFAPSVVPDLPNAGPDPTSSSCVDTGPRTGALCLGDSDRGTIRPYLYAGPAGTFGVANPNARTHHEVPMPVLLELDGFQPCQYWNPSRYVPAVNDGVLAVFYEPNQCAAFDQTSCLATVRNGLSNTMRYLSQPARVRRAFLTYAARAARLWSRETGVPAYFPQLVRVDQNLAIVAAGTAQLPSASVAEQQQAQLLRYCPDDSGASVPLPSPFHYQYVAGECGDLDAIAQAFQDAPSALSESARGLVRQAYATLDQHPPDAAALATWAPRIAAAADAEAEAVVVLRALASSTTEPIATVSSDEFTRRLVLAATGRAATAGEVTAWGALSRSARLDAVFAGYEAHRQLKRLGLRTAALNQGRFVFPLYEWLLARPHPQTDETEAAFWADELFRGNRSPATVVRDFVGSAEFSTRWSGVCAAAPAQCNAWYVEHLYRGLYHRAPDAGGLAYWAGELDAARKTRAEVAEAFLTAPEFTQRLQRLGL